MQYRRPPANQRRERLIENIKVMVKTATDQGKETSYKKMIAYICLENGISKRTCKEYIDLLIDSEQFIKIGDVLMTNPA